MLDKLAYELLINIADRLDVHSIYSLALSSRSTSLLLKDDIFWHMLILNRLGMDVKSKPINYQKYLRVRCLCFDKEASFLQSIKTHHNENFDLLFDLVDIESIDFSKPNNYNTITVSLRNNIDDTIVVSLPNEIDDAILMNGSDILIFTIMADNPYALDKLLHRVNPYKLTNRGSNVYLALSISFDRLDIIKRLLLDDRLRVNMGEIMLMACSYSSQCTMKYLLSNVGDIIITKEMFNAAIIDDRLDIVELLLKDERLDSELSLNNILIYSLRTKRLKIFYRLMSDSRIDPFCHNDVCLRLAIGSNLFDVVDRLLDYYEKHIEFYPKTNNILNDKLEKQLIAKGRADLAKKISKIMK